MKNVIESANIVSRGNWKVRNGSSVIVSFMDVSGGAIGAAFDGIGCIELAWDKHGRDVDNMREWDLIKKH